MKKLYIFLLVELAYAPTRTGQQHTDRSYPNHHSLQEIRRWQEHIQQRRLVASAGTGLVHHRSLRWDAEEPRWYRLLYYRLSINTKSGGSITLTYRFFVCSSIPTPSTLNPCNVQKKSHGWLASWDIYRVGNPWTRLRSRNCKCEFLCSTGPSELKSVADALADSKRAFRMFSVVTCWNEVDVG